MFGDISDRKVVRRLDRSLSACTPKDFGVGGELPFREPTPKGPDLLETLAQVRSARRSRPGSPAPQTQTRRELRLRKKRLRLISRIGRH